MIDKSGLKNLPYAKNKKKQSQRAAGAGPIISAFSEPKPRVYEMSMMQNEK